MIIKAKFE